MGARSVLVGGGGDEISVDVAVAVREDLFEKDATQE